MHAWGVDGPDQVPAYKACWRRAAGRLKAAAPGVALEWTNAKRTAGTALHVLDTNPGDDVVDLWGVHYYDSNPRRARRRSGTVLQDRVQRRAVGHRRLAAGGPGPRQEARARRVGRLRQPGQAAAGGGRPGLRRQHVPVLRGARPATRLRDLLRRRPARASTRSARARRSRDGRAAYRADWGRGRRRGGGAGGGGCPGAPGGCHAGPGGDDQAGQRRGGRGAGGRPQRRPGGLGRRPLRGLRLVRGQPRARRHQRRRRTSSSATAGRARPSGSASGRAAPRATRQLRPGDLGGRALRRLRLVRRPTWCRATPTAAGRVRPRPRDGHDRAGQRRAGRRAGERRQRLARALSADGRFVAFASAATNLVPGDTNGTATCSCATGATGTTERVSVASGGAQGNGDSYRPAISADGRYVAFVSDATNLVPGDTNGRADVFVRDREDGHDRAGERQRRAAARRTATAYGGLAISADGRFVAFVSDATNLVPGDTNGRADVFVRDRQDGHDRAGQRRAGRRPGRTAAAATAAGDLGGRALRRLRLGRHQPGAGRHQRSYRRVRARPRRRARPSG